MEEKPNLRRLNIDPDRVNTNGELLSRVIRLVVGILLVGQDGLRNQLPKWEAEAIEKLVEEDLAAQEPAGDVPTAPPAAPWFPVAWEHRLIGLAFDSPNYLKAGFGRLKSTRKSLWKISAPLRLPLEILGVSDFTQNWLEGFLERIQDDMSRLEEIGEKEAQTSRALGRVVLVDSLDGLLAYLAENRGIQELVQSQTSGITEEVISEVRERTVSADTLIDVLVRKLFRQPPLPPDKLLIPPPEEERDNEW